MLFRRRLGFSGTPSDLLPLDLGKCGYERGSDGKVFSNNDIPKRIQNTNNLTPPHSPPFTTHHATDPNDAYSHGHNASPTCTHPHLTRC